MTPLPTSIDPQSPEFLQRAAHNRALVARLRDELRVAKEDRSPKALARHREQGKLPAAERIARLLDPDTPFLEIGALAARGLYEGGVHKAGTIGGIGVIAGRVCMVNANDAMVKGGTIYPLGVKKALRLQAIAMENRLPFVSLIDSGGAYLPLQSEVFPDLDDGGRIFYNQARMSKMGIPQIAVVMGLCTAGAAYIPAMSDEVIHVRGTGAIFLGGPPLVKAATGEDVTAEDLGGADVHARSSGVTDYVVDNDEDAITKARELIAQLPAGRTPAIAPGPVRPPLYDPAELEGIIPEDLATPFDVREVIARITDGSEFGEFKALYGPTLVCGFATIHGYPVGILGNNGVLFSECAQKAAQFIQLCDRRGIPLVFLQNIPGFIIGKDYERAGITKHGHQMVNAVATASVPKFTVVVGGSFGAGNYAMCGRAYGPRFLWMWPNAQIGVMGADQAASVLISVNNAQRERMGLAPMSKEEADMVREPIKQNQLREGDAWYSTAQLWDDGIIEPAQTRDVLGLSIAAAMQAPLRDADEGFGVFRL